MDGRHGVPTRVADVRTTADDTPATAPAPTPPATVGPGLIDGLDEGVVVCDRAGVVRAANAAARAR
jgi:hypothetical protein